MGTETQADLFKGELSIELLADPIPKGRPRSRIYYDRSGTPRVQLYTPAATRKYEQFVRSTLLEYWGQLQLTGALWVVLEFRIQRPASVSARKRPWPTVMPDLDNLEKSVLDGMTAANVWKSDAQVCKVEKVKFYVNRNPGVRIRLRTLAPGDAP